MELNKKVSIIIPTFNRVESVVSAIESLLEQTYKNIEIIIVNDNGEKNKDITEKLEEKIKKYLIKKEIRYIKLEKNGGAPFARNEGVKVSTGEYLCFLDDDDRYVKEKIEKQIKKFSENNNENLGFIGSNLKYDTGIVDNKKRYYLGNQLKNHLLNQHGIVGTPTFMFRKKIFIEVSGFENVPIRQEYILILKILLKGYIGDYIEENLVLIKTSEDGITGSLTPEKLKFFYKIFIKRLAYIRKLKIKVTKEEKIRMKNEFYIDLINYFISVNNKKMISLYHKKLNKKYLSISNKIKLYVKIIFGKKINLIKKLMKGIRKNERKIIEK